MFTQCPECGVAFRVTAEVLKQAAGKVRCGGCGSAFNALEHLSEEKPHVPERRRSQPRLPELTPDEPPELEPDEAPDSISSEQSAALLKTLDELAGEDIRIEDTGAEWRVVGSDDDEETDDDAPRVQDLRDESGLIADTGSLKFVITDDSEDEASDDEVGEAPPQADAPGTVEEMRFDDNTPLPEGFDLDAPRPAPSPDPVAEVPEPVAQTADQQVDLELGDAGDWEDLLEEVAEPAVEPAADEPPDVDTQFAIQAEALGIDLSGLHEQADEEAVADAAAGTEVAGPEDRDKLETTIDEDLIAAAFEAEAAARERAKSEADEFGAAEEAEDREREPDFAADEEEPQEELELAAGADEPQEELELAAGEDEPQEDLELAAGEDEPQEELELAAGEDAPEEELELATGEDEPQEEPEFAARDEGLDEGAPLELDETAIEDAELLYEFPEQPVDERSLEIRLHDLTDAEDPGSGEHVVPELSEEEKTINMLIDQDLLSIAVEDDDGFASTIVQRQPDEKIDAEIEAGIPDEPEPPEAEAGDEEETEIEMPTGAAIAAMTSKVPLVETIIMEGESIRAEEDDEKGAKNRRLGAELKARQAREELLKPEKSGASRIGMIAAAVLLALVLVLQIVHQSREALATIPGFSEAVGPVYRMLGKPLTPAWDIRGWRFEATKGSTDEADEVLTIYSRIGNQSDDALPYPLVHVSLTDRFEDIIGSRVLEPGEYLGSDADPRELVPAGNTFNAVISIESPAAEATGFKLNVCYRLTGGQLRCAIEDFK